MNFSDSGDESCCTSEKRNSLLCFPCFRFNLLRVKVSPLCIYDGDDDSVSHESLPAHLHPWDRSKHFFPFCRKCLFLLSDQDKESCLMSSITVSVCSLHSTTLSNNSTGEKWKKTQKVFLLMHCI